MTPFIDQVYQKRFGIYSVGFDRFVLVDDKDVWIMIEAAEILSSKISTVVYIIPDDESGLTSSNCAEFSLLDKRSQKTATTPLLFSALTPSLRTLLENSLVKTDSVIPDEVIEYSKFVYLHCFALNFTEAIAKYDENSKFSKKYLDNNWIKTLSINDTRDNLNGGLYFQIRKILYMSSSIIEAEEKINSLWFNHSGEQHWVRDLYFKIINKAQPEFFKNIKNDPTKYTGYAG
jgi:hypothetical protein